MSAPFDVRILGATDTTTLRAMLSMFGGAFDDRPTCESRQPDDAAIASYTKLGVREDVLHLDIAPGHGAREH